MAECFMLRKIQTVGNRLDIILHRFLLLLIFHPNHFFLLLTNRYFYPSIYNLSHSLPIASPSFSSSSPLFVSLFNLSPLSLSLLAFFSPLPPPPSSFYLPPHWHGTVQEAGASAWEVVQ